MKISANEMLLINKNLKFKGDETNSVSTPSALAETPENESGIAALEAQSMNNIAFQGVNTSTLKNMGLKAMVALTLLGGASALTSCSEDDEPEPIEKPVTPPQVIINITNNVNISVTVNMTDEELINAILAEQQRLIELLEQMHKDQQVNHAEQMEINKAILAELVKQGISMDRIISLLEKMNMTAEDILNYVKENSDKQDAILNEITNGNAEQKEMLLQILNSVKKGNSLSVQNNKLLTMILVQMSKSNKNDQTMITLLNQILAKVNESIQTNKDIAKEQGELMMAILGKLSEIDDHLKQGVLMILNKIDTVSKENLKLLTKILYSIEEGNKQDENTNKILLAIFDKVQESIDQNHEMTEKTHELLWMVMDKIQGLDNDMKAGILAIIKNINVASEANINLLIKLITKVDQIGKDDDESSKVLYAILAKIQESIDANKEMNAQTYALLQSILDNVQNFNADLKRAVEALLAKMDQMSTENKAFFYEVLGKLDNMDNNAKTGIAMLIKQMAENNTLTEMQLNKLKQILAKLEEANQADLKFYNQSIALLSELLSKVDKLGDKADSILEAIGKISLDGSIDLSTIEKMLADLLAQSKANGDVLTSIDSKLNLIAITLEGIKTQLEVNEADNKAILAKLDEILAKIPEGCKCDKDIKVVIEILKKIAEEVGKGNNHEGILDDLEDLFQ